jgi:hypothetical protein
MITRENKEAIDTVIDVFSLNDGGEKLVKFLRAIERLEEENFAGSRDLLGLVQKFGKLVRIVTK